MMQTRNCKKKILHLKNIFCIIYSVAEMGVLLWKTQYPKFWIELIHTHNHGQHLHCLPLSSAHPVALAVAMSSMRLMVLPHTILPSALILSGMLRVLCIWNTVHLGGHGVTLCCRRLTFCLLICGKGNRGDWSSRGSGERCRTETCRHEIHHLLPRPSLLLL